MMRGIARKGSTPELDYVGEMMQGNEPWHTPWQKHYTHTFGDRLTVIVVGHKSTVINPIGEAVGQLPFVGRVEHAYRFGQLAALVAEGGIPDVVMSTDMMRFPVDEDLYRNPEAERFARYHGLVYVRLNIGFDREGIEELVTPDDAVRRLQQLTSEVVGN